MTGYVDRMMNLSRAERLAAAAVALCTLPFLGALAGVAVLDEWASPKGRRRRARIERRRLRREMVAREDARRKAAGIGMWKGRA